MKLSRQLALVSLVMLLLPWAGYEYLGQMSRTMADGLAMAQTARAQAVMAYLQSRPELLLPLLNSGQDERVFFSRFGEAPLIDAQLDDWPIDFTASSENVWAGFMRVRETLLFALDLQVGAAGTEFPALRLYSQDQIYALPLRPDGDVIAVDESGNLARGVLGKWRLDEDNLAIEVALPVSITGGRFGLELVKESGPVQWGLGANSRPLNWVTEQPALQAALDIFDRDNSRLVLLTTDRWSVASVGELSSVDAAPSIWQKMVVNLLPRQRNNAASAVLESWNWDTSPPRLRSEFPLHVSGLTVGILQVDSGLQEFLQVSAAALKQFLLGSLSILLLVALVLFAYSTWLSWRVTQLSRWTRTLIDEHGRVNDEFPASTSADEIGELSRAYADLTRRLKKHTDYLQGLAGRLSHEIRTPLTIIGSSLENLQSAAGPEEQQTYISRARQGVERLRSLLRRMSEVATLEAGIDATRRQNFDPDSLLAELTRAYQQSFPDLVFKFAHPVTGMPTRLNGSPDLLAQLVDKLIENASSFSPPGGKISLESRRVDAGWQLEISNSGPLLPVATESDIFASMVSLRSSNAGIGAHLGLGLSIARRIAEFHRGSISARNRSDASGVIFTLILPVG